MILLDAIFIIELFQRTKPWRLENGENDENDYMVKNPSMAGKWYTTRLDIT
jgi:hypothetical protein